MVPLSIGFLPMPQVDRYLISYIATVIPNRGSTIFGAMLTLLLVLLRRQDIFNNLLFFQEIFSKSRELAYGNKFLNFEFQMQIV